MKLRKSAIALVAVAALALTGCGSTGGGGDATFDEDLIFGSGGTAGTYYPLAGELATIFENNIDGLTVDYVESGGSGDNLAAIHNGIRELGLSQNDTAQRIVNGTLPDLEGTTSDKVTWVANLYPEAVHIIVRADSGIDSVQDLAGKRIAVGDAGSGTRTLSDAILEAYGIGEGDYTAEQTNFGTSADMLADNQIDASIFVVGTPVAGLVQLAAQTDVKLLSLDAAQAEQVASSTGADAYSISADAYDFLGDSVQTVSVFAALVASADLSDDLVYEITKAVFENAGSITLPVGASISAEEGLLGIGDVPLHPGAQRYYDEIG